MVISVGRANSARQRDENLSLFVSDGNTARPSLMVHKTKRSYILRE